MSWNDIVSGMMNGFFAWFVNALFGENESNPLQATLDVLTKAPEPILDGAAFMKFWEQNFGFAMIMAILGFVISLIRSMFEESKTGLLNSVLDVLKLLLIGYFLLYALHVAFVALDWVISILLPIANIDLGPTDKWTQALMDAQNFITGPFGPALNGFFGFLLRNEIELVQFSIYLFSVMFMLTYAFYRFKIGHFLLRLSAAALVTVLTVKTISVAFLVAGSVLLRLEHAAGAIAAIHLTVVVALASLLPIASFVTMMQTTKKVQVEGPTFTKTLGPNGRNAYSLGRANQRYYANEDMGSGTERAAKVIEKVGVATLAASAVFPEAAPLLQGIAKGAAKTAGGARWMSGQQRKADQNRQDRKSARLNG